MFVPNNPRVPGIGLAPQRAGSEPPHGGLVDALFARGHAIGDRSRVVVRLDTAFDRREAAVLAERQAPVGAPCGGTTAEA